MFLVSENIFNDKYGVWTDLDHGGVAVKYCEKVYILKVVDGDIIINEQTRKESAFIEIKNQPFFVIRSSVLDSYYGFS